MDAVKIKSWKAKTSRKGRDWAIIRTEDGEEILFLLDVFLASKLGAGDTLTAEDRERLDTETQKEKAKLSALDLLSYRARSKKELRRRLQKKDFTEQAIDFAIARIEDLGYIDDKEFARSFVRDRLNLNPKGPFALKMELLKKGVSKDIAEEVIQQEIQDNDSSFHDLALSLGEKWLRTKYKASDPLHKNKNRLYGHLARKGFSSDNIKSVLDKLSWPE